MAGIESWKSRYESLKGRHAKAISKTREVASKVTKTLVTGASTYAASFARGYNGGAFELLGMDASLLGGIGFNLLGYTSKGRAADSLNDIGDGVLCSFLAHHAEDHGASVKKDGFKLPGSKSKGSLKGSFGGGYYDGITDDELAALVDT